MIKWLSRFPVCNIYWYKHVPVYPVTSEKKLKLKMKRFTNVKLFRLLITKAISFTWHRLNKIFHSSFTHVHFNGWFHTHTVHRPKIDHFCLLCFKYANTQGLPSSIWARSHTKCKSSLGAIPQPMNLTLRAVIIRMKRDRHRRAPRWWNVFETGLKRYWKYDLKKYVVVMLHYIV